MLDSNRMPHISNDFGECCLSWVFLPMYGPYNHSMLARRTSRQAPHHYTTNANAALAWDHVGICEQCQMFFMISVIVAILEHILVHIFKKCFPPTIRANTTRTHLHWSLNWKQTIHGCRCPWVVLLLCAVCYLLLGALGVTAVEDTSKRCSKLWEY